LSVLTEIAGEYPRAVPRKTFLIPNGPGQFFICLSAIKGLPMLQLISLMVLAYVDAIFIIAPAAYAAGFRSELASRGSTGTAGQ
jgi:hypothetical protein